MKTSNANKVISVLMSVAMCPMMVPSAAFAADDDMTSDSSSSTELTQSSGQTEGADTSANSGTAPTAQLEATGTTTTSNENAAPQLQLTRQQPPAATTGEEGTGSAATGEDGTETGVAEVNGKSYPSLQAAIDAATCNATVKLLTETK